MGAALTMRTAAMDSGAYVAARRRIVAPGGQTMTDDAHRYGIAVVDEWRLKSTGGRVFRVFQVGAASRNGRGG